MDTNDLFYKLRKFLGPAALLLLGIIFMATGFSSEEVNNGEILEQSPLFKIGGITILILALVNLLYVLEIISGKVNLILFVVLIAGAFYMGRSNYLSIYGDKIDPEYGTVRWTEEKEFRYGHVKQRMMDIRSAQVAYRDKYRDFCENFELLIAFVKRDSVMEIREKGTNPGTIMSEAQRDTLGYPEDHVLTYLTNEEAIALGYMEWDTTWYSVLDAVFLNEEALSERRFDSRGNRIEFHVDSLGYVPFSEDENGNPGMFTMEIGKVSAGRQESSVIHLVDAYPYDPKDVLELGSLEQVSLSGNWGE